MALTATQAKNTVESLHDIVDTPFVPELKAVKAENQATHGAIDALRTEMRLLHEQTMQAIKFLDEKFTASIDVRERLAVLADRIKRDESTLTLRK